MVIKTVGRGTSRVALVFCVICMAGGWSLFADDELGNESNNEVVVSEWDISTLDPDASFEDIEVLLIKLQQETQATMLRAQDLKKVLWDVRNQARQNDPAVLEIRNQINELKAEIERTIDLLPDVKSEADEMAATQKKLTELMNVRHQYQQRLELARLKQAAEMADADLNNE